jgi:ABC-type Zn uptake system ZnuABC Zn-binding protein ZnuA
MPIGFLPLLMNEKKWAHKWVLTLAVLSAWLAACQPAPAPTADVGGKLKVVAMFSVIGELVQNVGGDKVTLTTLVGPGQDTHTFEPSPADAKALAEAALVLENGLGFETWLDDLYTASGSRATRIVVTDGVETRTATEGEEAGETDPHVWHSVANVIEMVRNIRDALAKADSVNATTYQANADQYIAELEALDAWVFEQVKTLPAERRKLVTTHDTFGYFADRYGFEVVGTVLPSTTEGASPSAQELAALVEAVKAEAVPAVFAENVSSNALLNQVAAEAGVEVVASLYTDALGPPGSEGDTYLKMVRYNVTTIVAALR